MKISVIINTYNASKHLKQVLEAVKGFDEIVICDMESTDDTIEIAKTFNCKIVTFKKGNYNIVEPARNFAIQQASHPWILVVDADEVVPEQLKEYLYKQISSPDCPAGIYIPRKNYFMGRFMHCHYPDHILRFFKKEGTVWPPIIHVSPIVQGTLFSIPARRKELAFIHLANDSVSDIIRKTNEYTRNEVERKKNKRYGTLAFFYRPFFRFFKTYILKGGIRDGKEGFIKACLEGYYQFIMLSKLTEHHKSDRFIKKSLDTYIQAAMQPVCPLVSIIIPVYNTEKYLSACIDSVLKQTYTNWELILVNDGSTDGSLDIIKQYALLDSRIKYIDKINSGPSLSRKSGTDQAKGKYIQYLDSDDFLQENAIEYLTNKAETTNAEVVAAPFFFYYSENQMDISGHFSFQEMTGMEYFNEILLGRAYWSVWSNFLSRSLFEKNDILFVPEISFGEDAILMVQLLYHTRKVVALEQPILYYRQIESSICHDITPKRHEDLRTYTKWIERFMAEKGLYELYHDSLTLKHIEMAFLCMHWGYYENVDKDMKRIVKDIKERPQLLKCLPGRQRRIIKVYRFSPWLGFLNLMHYKKRGKL